MLKQISSGALLLCLFGCDSGPSVEKVTGKVTLDGTPVPGARITFSPVSGGTGAPAVGTTDSSGIFTVTDMKSESHGSGAKAGEYKVGVLWYKPSDPSSASATGDSAAPTELSDDKAERTKATGPEVLMPTAYGDPETSGLTVTVAPGENNFDFTLESKYKGPSGK